MQNQPELFHGDGTSQADRIQKALDPGYVSVDERSIKDLLAFAQTFAKELRYFNEQNKVDGDWSRFLGAYNLDEIVAYLNDPKPNSTFSRPHLVLFLTFLQLLQTAHTQLNDLTRRHLDFYYREALRLTSQKGVPDQVHVLVTLADGQKQFPLPAGTLLHAGQDSLGNDLVYRSDEELMVNRASVESLKSLFSEKMIIGIREARQNPDLIAELFPANKDLVAEGIINDRGFMAMLVMALGNPGPGSPLPLYPDQGSVTVALLADLDRLLAFLPDNLYMPFSTFRSLMQLKLAQTQTADQWKRVNDTIEAAGKKRDANFTLDRSQPDNFEKNLLAALGRTTFDHFFDGLPEVTDIYDLYRRSAPDSGRDDVFDFIKNALFMTVDGFTAMMKTVEEINGRWRQIYEILRAAGRRKDPDRSFPNPNIRGYDANKFATLVAQTLGTITYPTITAMKLADFDDCNREISKLENYFHITAEEFVSIRLINGKADARPWEWEQVYEILERAHTEKELADRLATLKDKRKKLGFQGMLLFALGDPKPGNPLPGERDFKLLNPSLDESKPNADNAYINEKLFLGLSNFLTVKNTEASSKASDEDWDRVYAILEQAQRQKRGTKPARAEIEKWSNLYATADATQVQVRVGAEGDSATPRWRTFGTGYSAEQAFTAPAKVGFAIASPLLALAEGRRIITLTLGFREEKFDRASVEQAIKAPYPFQFFLSSQKEMVAVKTVSMKLLEAPFTVPGAENPYPRALQITLTLDEQSPPVTPLTISPFIQTPWPVLQMLLADLSDSPDKPGDVKPKKAPIKRYRAFQSLMLEKMHLRVDVAGLTTLTLQNDTSVLDPKKPFEPFGFSPVVGSSFYIAHPELCSKKLDNLTLSVDWLGAPKDFGNYYQGYKDYSASAAVAVAITNASFKARLRLFDNRSFFDVGTRDSKGNVQFSNLFNTESAQNNNVITINSADIAKGYPVYQRDAQPTIAAEVLDWRRYWQLELQSSDFQHVNYPRSASDAANAKTSINPPYTPKIKHLSAGYSASLEIDLMKAGLDLNVLTDRLYHIEPFGYRDLAGDEAKTVFFFLPQYDNEGELFIGIKNMDAPQSLSLLFQLAEGSANPDLAQQTIVWEFLDGNLWSGLQKGQLLSDTTNGLLNSGIIQFNLAAVKPSTLLPTDLYWIRATIVRNSRSVGDTVAIRAQAVRATFADQNNAPDHLAQPLPANSISKLVEPQAEIKSIQQPYSSFGGKSPEQARSFYTRVSERLRHKNRALTTWDYEHLVLEAFPGIFKVKCLPVGVSDDPGLANVIQVIVIPNIKGKLPFDPFEPKSPADVLLQIEQYLKKQCAPFAEFKVKNPSYLRLQVWLNVRLRSDANTGYYVSLLNDELQRYLAPWAYDHSAEIIFGGEINSSLIVNFVEGRPYVDYVAGITLYTSPDGQHFKPYNANDPGISLAPDTILVSDRSHQINLIAEEGYDEQFFTGINYMKIEINFQIAS